MFLTYNCFIGYKIHELIPEISLIIEGENTAYNFIKAHDKFYSNPNNNSVFWELKGKSGSISVQFEKSEMYLHFHVFTKTKHQQEKVENLIDKYT